MPGNHPPRIRLQRSRSVAHRLPAMIGLPLMLLAPGAQAQLPAGMSGVNVEAMDLASVMLLVQQQRTTIQNADPGQQPQPQLQQEQQQLTKQEQERKEQLRQLEQKIKRQEQVKQEQTKQEQTKQEQTKQEQTKQEQQTKQPLTAKEQAVKEQQQLELLQQKMKQEEQAKQELQTKTGQQQAKSQPSGTPDGKIVSPPRQQLLALLDPGNGKSSSALTTTGDVAIHLASGQGNRDAQAQIVASAVGTAVTGPAPAGSIPPEATMPSAGVTATGIAGITTGVAAVAAALGAAVSSSDGGGAVQSALQQQQQQSAVTAATAAQQQAFSYVTANLVTPLASFPTSMQATYTGPVTGSASVGAGVTGTFQAQVDFATIRGGAPSVPGTITFANGLGGTSFTLTLMGGFVGGAMSGTYAGQAVTGFVMNGRFYGPAAEQLAGSWSMQNAGATLTGSGSFKAQR